MHFRTLHNGVKMPLIGLGTWQLNDAQKTGLVVRKAIEIGYRHIDTASIYRNEHLIGPVLTQCYREHLITRKELFICSKIPPTKIHTTDSILETFSKTLSDLETDYVDLLLIHWPGAAKISVDNHEKLQEIRLNAWGVLEKLYNEGKCKAIGVSNFKLSHLQPMIEKIKIIPHVNQIEYHPLYWKQYAGLEEFCKKHNIVIEGYSPFGRGAVMEKGVSSAQALQWSAFGHGVAVLPKSENFERLKANFESIEHGNQLSQQDMERIDALDDNTKVCWDPETIA